MNKRRIEDREDKEDRINEWRRHKTEWVEWYLQNAEFQLDFLILPVSTLVGFDDIIVRYSEEAYYASSVYLICIFYGITPEKNR